MPKLLSSPHSASMTMLIARKFARYFEVEARIIPVCKESNYCLGVSKIREHLDENTIGLSSNRYH